MGQPPKPTIKCVGGADQCALTQGRTLCILN